MQKGKAYTIYNIINEEKAFAFIIYLIHMLRNKHASVWGGGV